MSTILESAPDTASSRTGLRGIAAPRCPAEDVAGRRLQLSAILLLALVVAHAALGIAMFQSPTVATAHALLTLAVALYLALRSTPVAAAYAAAYIAGAEVLWRMTGAAVFWEFAKYAIVATLVLSLLRFRPLKLHYAALCYFTLLLPSALLTAAALPWARMRSEISFNLSGPLAIAVCTCFFVNLVLPLSRLHRLFISLMAPLTGIAAISAFSTLNASHIVFRNSSNYVTSGFFGPVQVSLALGFGALLGTLFLLYDRSSLPPRLVVFALTSVFLLQCLLTFSRSGAYSAGIALIAAGPALLSDRRLRPRAICLIVVLLIGAAVAVPFLNSYTRGAFSVRFTELSPTGRVNIARADLAVWRDNPLLGVGPGMAKYVRGGDFGIVAAHTEFTRVLAEHGFLGLLALVCLLAALLQQLAEEKAASVRALTLALVTWALAFMLTDATRMAMAPFVLGIALTTVAVDSRIVRGRVAFVLRNNKFTTAPPATR